jgi:hypothetical protein
LPYVESDNIYKATTLPIQQGSVVPSYNAPSDPYNSDNLGIVNFGGNIRLFGYETLGPALANTVGTAVTVPANTVKVISNMTLSRIVDGTTNVLMLVTKYSDCNGFSTRYADHPSGGKSPNPAPPGGATKTVGGFFGAGTHSLPAGRAPDAKLMFQITPTNDGNTTTGCGNFPAVFGHSFGAGGLSGALADASVKNVSPTMAAVTFGRAVAPGDQAPLGADWAAE